MLSAMFLRVRHRCFLSPLFGRLSLRSTETDPFSLLTTLLLLKENKLYRTQLPVSVTLYRGQYRAARLAVYSLYAKLI